ncbi:MAG: DEAD/DEAH box helicase [Clostridia bacterium]|nr:DEAD/DEAH box helicase [Clostridia bacterium]
MTDVINTFEELELRPELTRALTNMGFTQPTPIQQRAIWPLLEGRDVIAKAPTGTGKTCSFGIPLLECFRPDCNDIQGIVICPTRELCIQIADDLRSLGAYMPQVRIVALYGGQPINKQIAALQKHPHIVVATPGRLIDHMNRGNVWLGNVYTAVLDEADEMLKMGFIKDVRKILNATPQDTQVALFSATISREVMNVAWEYQRDAVEITVEAQGDQRPDIAQYALPAVGGDRLDALHTLLGTVDLHRVMVFANRKVTVQWLCNQLKRRGCSVDCLHGDIPQSQRNRVMEGFRKGKFEVLVCTDVAARGIDVDDVEAVFNYDIPDENEYYLHRIGRTGRAKRHGMAITFVSPDDGFRMRDIKKYTHSDIIDITLDETGKPVCADGTSFA